jgi:chromatin remodeling complex protein RSC6
MAQEKVPKKVMKLLDTYETVLKTIETIEQKISIQKTAMEESNAQLKKLKKLMNQMIAKQTKKIKDPSKERSPHGFARPTHISDELCDFMGLERNTMISRISVTNFLIDYIKKNNLQNPSNRRIILPDDKLSKIFGEESKDKVIDYFTMQKYVNHHFTPVNLSNAVLDA